MRNAKFDAVVAYHEAGHAVVCLSQDVACHRITIDPEGDTAGSNDHELLGISDDFQYDPQLGDEEKALVSAMICYGGNIAQRRYASRSVHHDHARADRMYAYDLASVVCDTDDELRLWLRLARIRAETIIERRWPAVCAIASALVDRRTLTGAETDAIYRATMEQVFDEAVAKRGRVPRVRARPWRAEEEVAEALFERA